MKPIGRNFGFLTLAACSFGMSLVEHHTAAAIYMVGAVLFDAIKTRKSQ